MSPKSSLINSVSRPSFPVRRTFKPEPREGIKRSLGQITIYIILSMVLIILISLLYNRVVSTEKRVLEFTKTSQQWDVESIRGAVQTCVNRMGADAVFYFGMVGGRTSFFKSFYVYDDLYRIPFYFRFGTVLMPSIHDAESKILARYVNTNLQKCTRPTISAIPGFRIAEGEITTSAAINEKTVDFTVKYPLTITKQDQSTTISEFSFSLPSRLFDILGIAQEIVNREVADESVVHWDLLSDITNRGYNITAHAEADQTIVYRIIDPQSQLYFEPFIFQFANQVRVRE